MVASFFSQSVNEIMRFSIYPQFIFNFQLIAALIFSAGYYSATIFLQFKEFELYWGAVFLRLEEESFFLINFIGVIFEAGNETRKKIWSDFGAEQKLRAERKESGFCSYRCFERARN